MHIPVLLPESIEALSIKQNGVYVDGTLGGAGHALEITRHLGPDGTLIGFDLDSNAIARAQEKLKDARCKVILVQGNFRNIDNLLSNYDYTHVDGIFLDLGFSSFQIEDPDRGLSFQHDGPLTMTLSDAPRSEILTAWDIVNKWEESTIADVIYMYGDERHSRKIARAIFEARKRAPIDTTMQLVEVIHSVMPRKPWMKTNPATKTFQALRIATNDEYGAVNDVLAKGFELLKSGGRFAIITFHSGEDRIVKNYFRDHAHAGTAKLLTKKPIMPGDDEVKSNPRSRSAQLRVIEKV